jgi:hypothetical protein
MAVVDSLVNLFEFQDCQDQADHHQHESNKAGNEDEINIHFSFLARSADSLK